MIPSEIGTRLDRRAVLSFYHDDEFTAVSERHGINVAVRFRLTRDGGA
ncbi:hypothetical protein [Thermogymnomonas acidicola]|nr:hypothetical protein [Thermogymnomonas acidicola]